MTKEKKKNFYEKSYEGCITTEDFQKQFNKNENMNWRFFTRALGIVAGFSIGAGMIYGAAKLSKENIKSSFNEERENISVLIISDGLVTVNNYASKDAFIPGFHNKINNIEYEVSYYDDRYLIIYAYGDDDVNRKSVMDYIMSTIEIKENNAVSFDSSKLSEEEYNEYINSVIKNNEQGVQRTRTEN